MIEFVCMEMLSWDIYIRVSRTFGILYAFASLSFNLTEKWLKNVRTVSSPQTYCSTINCAVCLVARAKRRIRCVCHPLDSTVHRRRRRRRHWWWRQRQRQQQQHSTTFHSFVRTPIWFGMLRWMNTAKYATQDIVNSESLTIVESDCCDCNGENFAVAAAAADVSKHRLIVH